jgi:hypothetical protein
MDLNDARAFVVPRGKYRGQTIQGVASGGLEDVREMLDAETEKGNFQEALETFVAWVDSESDPDTDVPPDTDGSPPDTVDLDEDDADDEYEGDLGE